jgi:uncharacterized protein YqhQ
MLIWHCTTITHLHVFSDVYKAFMAAYIYTISVQAEIISLILYHNSTFMGIPCYYDDDEEEEDLLQNLNDIHQLQMISHQVLKDLL